MINLKHNHAVVIYILSVIYKLHTQDGTVYAAVGCHLWIWVLFTGNVPTTVRQSLSLEGALDCLPRGVASRGRRAWSWQCCKPPDVSHSFQQISHSALRFQEEGLDLRLGVQIRTSETATRWSFPILITTETATSATTMNRTTSWGAAATTKRWVRGTTLILYHLFEVIWKDFN